MASSNKAADAVKTVKVLLDCKADLSSLDSSDRSALHRAAENNAVEVMRLLLQSAQMQGRTPYILREM